jgi:hypothetical protein
VVPYLSSVRLPLRGSGFGLERLFESFDVSLYQSSNPFVTETESWISSIKEIIGKFSVANEAMQNSFHPPNGNFGKRCLLHKMVDH